MPNGTKVACNTPFPFAELQPFLCEVHSLVLEDNTLGVEHTGVNRYTLPHTLAHRTESLKLGQDAVKLLQFVRLDT